MEWADAIRAMTVTLDNRGTHYVAQDPTLTADVTAYVLDGTDTGVLQRLRAFSGMHLGGMTARHGEGEHPARALYDAFATVPHDVLIRWGLVLQATAGHSLHSLGVDKVYWPGAMLAQVGLAYPDGELPFDFFDFAALLATAGVHSGRLVVHAWQLGKEKYWRRTHPEETLVRLRGYGAAVGQLHQWLAPLLVEGDADHRVHALRMLAPAPDDVLVGYAEQVTLAATCGSAQVRETAAPLVPRLGTAGVDQLRLIAVDGSPDSRRHALRTLWDTAADDDQRVFARETALADRAASVRAVAEGFVDAPPPEAVPLPDVPETAPVQWSVEITPELSAVIDAWAEEQRWWTPASDAASTRPPRLTPADGADLLKELLASPEPVTAPVFAHIYSWNRVQALGDGLAADVVPPAAVGKLYIACGLADRHGLGLASLSWAATPLHEHRDLTLLDLVALLAPDRSHDPVRTVAQGWFWDDSTALGLGWAPEAVWPFFAAHLDAVLDYWTERRAGHSHGFDSEAIFRAVASFPEPPTRLLELCYDLALGSARSDQRAAQDFLSTHPEAVRRATAALADGNGTVRAVAAEWLGRIGDRTAVPALAAAFTKEKNETVQGALLDALVALGERLEDHFDLASVDAQAAKAATKGLPAALSWLRPDSLPAVRRADRSGTVPQATMLWLVARATAAKSSVPGALLRACTGQLDASDAADFADALLTQWVAADEESVGRTSGAQYGLAPRSGPSPGAAGKGLLALVAACGSATSVAAATRYVRTWHGQRAQQSKAVVTMLAHHRDPAAAEALVAIAYRFKAPSIEKAAREEVAALADRLGWTRDELADRTVATAGFDEHGVIELPYGERAFTARLLPDCGVELRDPEGKTVKTLPAPRQSDDAEAAKESKRLLAAARKQLTETVRTQTGRLHDALCTQRAWTGADWLQDLAAHPVLARLAAQLVWSADAGGRRLTFRLLDDGTLTGVDDEEVTLPHDAEVRIAHDVTLADEEVVAWQQHLTDYEVPSLFWQLGRGRAELTEEDAAATRLEGVASLPGGRLEQLATRLGYRRGSVGDGAAYDWFEKEFTSLGLTARILLQGGHAVGDHETPATVEGLEVSATAGGQPVALGELPPVLVVELRHDLAVVTAA